MATVSTCQSFGNKVPQTERLRQQTIYFLAVPEPRGRKSEIKAWEGLVPALRSLPGLQTAVLSLHLHRILAVCVCV